MFYVLCVQVDQMVGYAMGEMTSQEHATLTEHDVATSSTVAPVGGDRQDDKREKCLKLATTHTHKQRLSKPTSCYEVVTAWVHPK